MEQYNAFTIPIWKIGVTNWNDRKESFMQLPDWSNEKYYLNDISANGDDGYFSDYFAAKEAFMKKEEWYNDKFLDLLSQEISEFCNNLNISNLDIGFIWAQRYKRREGMGVHTHGGSGISAVLYADFNENEHRSTQFISPFHDVLSNAVILAEPDVKEGDILFFPSYLLHHALPSTSDISRTIFSFNAEIK